MSLLEAEPNLPDAYEKGVYFRNCYIIYLINI